MMLGILLTVVISVLLSLIAIWYLLSIWFLLFRIEAHVRALASKKEEE